MTALPPRAYSLSRGLEPADSQFLASVCGGDWYQLSPPRWHKH